MCDRSLLHDACVIEEKTLQNQIVRLLASGGEIDRVVVTDLGDVVTVCRVEELEAAKREGRKPLTVGFRKSSVVTVVGSLTR